MLNKKSKLQKTKGKNSGVLFIVSAPSGAGKTTLCKMAVDFFPDLRHSVSYTTRQPRDGEINGIDYNFVSQKTFDKMLERGEFLEWAEVHGCKYGTSIKDLNTLIAKGLDVILDIDVQGAKQVKKWAKIYSILKTFLFILPPSMAVCEQRLKNRGKDDKETIEKRIENARREIKESIWYDYIIINDDINAAFERFKSVIIAEKSKRGIMLNRVKKLFSTISK